MRVTRALVLSLAAALLLTGVSLGLRPDAVLARCYPSGALADASRYYVRHWAAIAAGLGLVLTAIGLRGDRSLCRVALATVAVTYALMVTNFWTAYSRGHIPYAPQCVGEELGIELLVAALLVFGGVWEWRARRERPTGE